MRDPDGLRIRSGVHGDVRRDQHFLIDERVLNRIPEYAIECDFDLTHVLEIGAGTGGLTDRLLAEADMVTAIERDSNLVDFLQREFTDAVTAGTLHVIRGDALAVELPEYTVSIANLPYSISSQIVFRLLPHGRPLVLMFQREFAERMIAEPGNSVYGRLSVSAQHYATIEIVETVPNTAFSPKPAVESCIVRMNPRKPPYSVDDEPFFFGFVKAVFTQRRKTLRNAIRNTGHISAISDPDAVLEMMPEDLLSKRAGEVTPAEFAALANLARTVSDIDE